jgi:hypothetical protein
VARSGHVLLSSPATEAFFDHCVNGAFNKASGNSLAIASAFGVIWDRGCVVFDIRLEFGGGFSQGLDAGIVGFHVIQICSQILDDNLPTWGGTKVGQDHSC